MTNDIYTDQSQKYEYQARTSIPPNLYCITETKEYNHMDFTAFKFTKIYPKKCGR